MVVLHSLFEDKATLFWWCDSFNELAKKNLDNFYVEKEIDRYDDTAHLVKKEVYPLV